MYMKQLCVSALAAVLLLASRQVTGQSIRSIEPHRMAVTCNKTSNIIFPFSIRQVDRGSAEVLAQIVPGADSILHIKAVRKYFTETNLSVVTADGSLHSFILTYADQPSVLNARVVMPAANKAVQVEKSLPNEAELKKIVASASSEAPFMHRRSTSQKMSLRLDGIYLKNRVMCFRLTMDNNSFIDYVPEFVRFFVRDRRRTKRTAVQETELHPLHCSGISNVAGQSSAEMLLTFMPITIPTSQELIIQVREKNGGRALSLRVPHNILLRAQLLGNNK